MREVLDKVSIGVVILSKKGVVEYANEFCTQRGITPPDYAGRKYYEVMRSLDLIGFVRELLEGKAKPMNFELSGRTFKAVPLENIPAFQIEDITQLVRFEKLQKEFAASVSHELSTPITAIRGLLETALLDEPPKREFVEKALKRVEGLENLIKALRFLVLLDTRAVLNRERLPLKSLISSVIQDLREEIDTRGVSVEIEGEEVEIESDREKLYVLLKNLIENAVRYNRERGKVLIELERTPNGVEVRIEDTGEGISKEELPLIFQPFVGGKNKKGMGLGLAISKKIANFLGAELEIESEERKGTKVRVSLPES
ncbi:two-component system phosphate regulon sensor histidine kinase PhoR [Hydrogenivirga caldilitoris]|uniref:histidine kinase n=1 Tax=Hydrogenivirga caldilitoris TaxID=246264 RepID=A0A497XPS0_9AQUI|nr:HAMP domain-containing sensor histidine kinase [Hydrogenivirga caldilitoris]RLJ70955.1 two-component system phosphate regulon sensor histidine kinase PhoR [Hydrogenivirga caldilitoris]